MNVEITTDLVDLLIGMGGALGVGILTIGILSLIGWSDQKRRGIR